MRSSSYTRPFRAIARWYDKAAAFNVESIFSRKRQSVPKRTIYVNEDLPTEYLDKRGRVMKDHVYDTNQVITSKYTVITFVPRNLLEQFRRVANMSVARTFFHVSASDPSLDSSSSLQFCNFLKSSRQYPQDWSFFRW